MTSSEVDLSQLTESQQLALQQFTTVTNQNLEAAVALLRRSEWNVQIAISKLFDGETASATEESASVSTYAAPPRLHRRRELLLDGSTTSSRHSAAVRRLIPAPRIGLQSGSRVGGQLPFVVALLFLPFNFLYQLLGSTFGFFGRLFSSRRSVPFLRSGAPNASGMKDEGSEEMRPLSPRETASRYVRWFQEEYGPTKLPFHEDGYAQALDLAKKELRFLIVILMSPEHDNTSSFVRSTLLSQEVVDYLTSPRHHILLWGGSVQEADASQIAAALHCTKFPFTAIIAHTPQISSTSMSVVAQIVGPTPAAAFLARIKDAVAQYSEALEATRASRASHEAERQLRDQQNSAYEISLARDRARVKENRKAEAAALRVQQEAAQKIQAEQRRIQQQERWKRWRMQSLSPEPALDSAGATRVSIRMLSGERILRRFAPDVDMEELYAFVECYGENRPSNELVDQPKGYEHQFTFRLISPFPLKVYEPQLGVTIRECVGKNVNLIVEAVDDGHEDEN